MIILTTGFLNGIGKYIHEELGGIGLDRNSPIHERDKLINKRIDIIIHCAFNSNKEVNSKSLYSYLEDNILLTREIVSVPHKKFIYFSSVDVYPKEKNYHTEDEVISINSVSGIYGITKLMSEAIIKNYSKNYLILRPTSLLGKYTRKNNLTEMIESDNCKITLKQDSELNYVLYCDVLAFIKLALEKDLRGIYNVASAKNIKISEIASLLKKKITMGDYYYNVGNIDNSKISALSPVFKRTSQGVITQFIGKRYA